VRLVVPAEWAKQLINTIPQRLANQNKHKNKHNASYYQQFGVYIAIAFAMRGRNDKLIHFVMF